MSSVTSQGLLQILIGTELGGDKGFQYKCSFAVPNSLLGRKMGGNASGFSFGAVQLDIGANSHAQAAYVAMLDNAVTDGVIPPAQRVQLLRYKGARRPDLDPILKTSYSADRAFLTSKVFSRAPARQIIDDACTDYLDTSLRPSVDGFIDAVVGKWGPGTVFDSAHPDFHTAVSAVASISNRTGGLKQSTQHFLNLPSAPTRLADVKARYDAVLGDHWHLVEKGGAMYKASGIT